jgi:hypothetical protein
MEEGKVMEHPTTTTARAHHGVTPKAMDATQVQAIFDAMTTLMGTTWASCTASVHSVSGGSNNTCTVSDQWGNSQTTTSVTAGNRIALAPFGVSLGPAGTQQFTATITDNSGNTVTDTLTWSVQGTGTIDQTGLYTAPATITANSSDTITAKDTGGASSSITVNLHP